MHASQGYAQAHACVTGVNTRKDFARVQCPRQILAANLAVFSVCPQCLKGSGAAAGDAVGPQGEMQSPVDLQPSYCCTHHRGMHERMHASQRTYTHAQTLQGCSTPRKSWLKVLLCSVCAHSASKIRCSSRGCCQATGEMMSPVNLQAYATAAHIRGVRMSACMHHKGTHTHRCCNRTVSPQVLFSPLD